LRAYKIAAVFLIGSILSFSTYFPCAVATSLTNWSEVARFTGSGTEGYITEEFNCAHAEWRIRWNYTPNPEDPNSAVFSFITYPKQGGLMISNISQFGASEINGTSYVHNRTGTFYSEVNVENTSSYEIIIEQDLDTIPELSRSFVCLLLVGLAIAVLSVHRKRSGRL
jgi:hypothetical protein